MVLNKIRQVSEDDSIILDILGDYVISTSGEMNLMPRGINYFPDLEKAIEYFSFSYEKRSELEDLSSHIEQAAPVDPVVEDDSLNRPDNLGIFFRDTCKHRLLTREEEYEIGRKIHSAKLELYDAISSSKCMVEELAEIIRSYGRRDDECKEYFLGFSKLFNNLPKIGDCEKLANRITQLSKKTTKRSKKGLLKLITDIDPKISKTKELIERLKQTGFVYSNCEDELRKMNEADEKFIIERNKLLSYNQKLIFSCAKHYRPRLKNGLEVLDLIQEANNGLISAAEKYDPSRKLKFSTYAVWWIRQSIGRFIQENNHTIRRPVHQQEIETKIFRAEEAIIQRVGNENYNPTDEEICEVDPRLSIESVRAARRLLRISRQSVVSLDMQIGDKEEDTMGNVVEDKSVLDSAKIVGNQQVGEVVTSLVNALPHRERLIILERFGLNGHEVKTLEEIGRKYKVTRERIRQIEAKALRRLRHPARMKFLEDALI